MTGNEPSFDADDLAFFGAVAAGVSHEIKNILSIVNESAGLLTDLSLAAERGRPLDPGRVAKLAGDLARSVERGVAVVNTFNRFAHGVEAPARPVALNAVVADAVFLAGRLASSRGTRIEVALPEAPMALSGSAFAVHRALAASLRIAVLDCEGAQPARVELTGSESEARIRLTRPSLRESQELEARWQALARLVAEMGGRVEREPQESKALALLVRLPLAK